MPEYEPHTVVIMDVLPDCDLCKVQPIGDRATARRYDARLRDGMWAHVCQGHFEDYGLGKLGLGIGQELITPERVAAERALDEASKMFLADPNNLFKQDVWLEAHRQLVNILHPATPIPTIAENHPMRNHPAFRAAQARMQAEARYVESRREEAGDPE